MAGAPHGGSILVGVISDTHGIVRPEALAALAGCDRILHAGDVGTAEVLSALERIAPLTAVRGNADRGDLARRLPATAVVELGGLRIGITHDALLSPLDAKADALSILVSGHSHRPAKERRDGTLFFNPGSAGPRRFGRPATVGRLRIARGRVRAQLVRIT
jgi:putative phosphoesterase